MPAQTTFLQRYLHGEQEQVWADVLALGDSVRNEPVFTDALAVARETMRRAKENIELLIPRLAKSGYQFGYGWIQPRDDISRFTGADRRDYDDEIEWARDMPRLYSSPVRSVHLRLAELEQFTGTPPLSLYAFFEVVGGVNFVGYHPRWRGGSPMGLDPLMVVPLDYTLEMYREGSLDPLGTPRADDETIEDDMHDEDVEDGMLGGEVPVAPDHYFKYNISGLGSYHVVTPCYAADAPLELEWHNTTFVSYLRTCFQWAGLPGLERDPMPPLDDIAALTHDLLPL